MNIKALTVSVALAAVVSAAAFADDPITLTGVSCQQDIATRDLVVDYTLNGQPAIVRLEVKTNNVSIGRQNLKTFMGDGCSATTTDQIQPGTHTIRWCARQDWPDVLATDLKVNLCAFYPAEVSTLTPTFYDDYARTGYTTVGADTAEGYYFWGLGWTGTKGVPPPGGDKYSSFYSAAAGGISAIYMDKDYKSLRQSEGSLTVMSPVFDGVEDWRITLKMKLSIEYTAYGWDEAYKYAWIGIFGLDENGEQVFRLRGNLKSNNDLRMNMGGIMVPNSTSVAYTELALIRSSKNTFAVHGKLPDADWTIGSTNNTIDKPNSRVCQLKIVFLGHINSDNPVASGRALFADFKVDDISASPF